jgi:hypothetical protein
MEYPLGRWSIGGAGKPEQLMKVQSIHSLGMNFKFFSRSGYVILHEVCFGT